MSVQWIQNPYATPIINSLMNFDPRAYRGGIGLAGKVLGKDIRDYYIKNLDPTQIRGSAQILGNIGNVYANERAQIGRRLASGNAALATNPVIAKAQELSLSNDLVQREAQDKSAGVANYFRDAVQGWQQARNQQDQMNLGMANLGLNAQQSALQGVTANTKAIEKTPWWKSFGKFIGENIINTGKAMANAGAVSDERLKEKIEDYNAGLDQILALKPKEFTYKQHEHNLHEGVQGLRTAGVIAQDVKDKIPAALSIARGGYYHVDQNYIIYALVNAVKELAAKIESIE